MTRTFTRTALAAAASIAGVLGLIAVSPRMTAQLSGQAPGFPEHEKRRVAVLHRRRQGLALLAARSDQRRQLQPARSRLAIQDRQPGHASRVQARRHAADGQGHGLRDRRHAPLGGRARRQDRRADLGPRRKRRHARRQGASPAFGPRPLVLDRRQGRRPRHLRDAGLSPDLARTPRPACRSPASAKTASST